MATAELSTAEEEAPESHDHAEPVFFESEAVAALGGADESEGEGESDQWTTPEYALAETAAKAKGAEEEGGAEWQAPEYSDSASLAPSGRKEYAKLIATPAAPSGILLESVASADSSAVIFRPRSVGRRRRNGRSAHRPGRNAQGGRRHETVAATPLRYKVSDRLVARPRWNRFDPYSPRHPNPAREAARAQFEKATHLSYDRLEAYCSTRLPELFGKFCRVVLRRFRRVAEGLRYGDRPNQVCMAIKMCPNGSYVRKNPHNILKRFHTHKRK